MTAVWIDRLGWTLLHFLWQGMGVAAIYAVARKAAARSTASVRYTIGCMALATMLLAPLITLAVLTPADSPVPVAASTRQTPNDPALTSAVQIPTPTRLSTRRVLPWVVIVWLGGAAILLSRLFGGWIIARRMRSTMVRSAPAEWRGTFENLAQRAGVTRPVQLLISALVQVPTVVGWLRPVVLIPVGALTGLPFEHIAALMVHELAHIRRHDYLVNIFQSIVEALLFYHPAVWWISRHVRDERELCCDHIAISINGDAFTYASALMELESLRASHRTLALAANGGALKNRIARLLGQTSLDSPTVSGPGILAGVTILAATACVLLAQPPLRPHFEVASVKPNTSDARLVHIIPSQGGRLDIENVPLKLIIATAYGLQQFQISGAPGWTSSDRYDIRAKAAGNPPQSEIEGPMLQSLLEERFQLRHHRETRQLPVYALIPGKNGPKLQPSKPGSCMKYSMDQSFGPTYAPSQAPPCGFRGFARDGLHMYGVTTAELAAALSAGELRTSVLDKTGIIGTFDVDLKWTRQSMEASPAPEPSDTGPSIFTALPEQLGLRLESTKGPVDIFVIDHIEKPADDDGAIYDPIRKGQPLSPPPPGSRLPIK